MTDPVRPLIVGNWKMNGLKAALAEFDAMCAGAGPLAGKADLLVCPPATLITAFTDKARQLIGTFPESPYQRALQAVTELVTERDH